ncbi:MAG: hypothetical protein IKF29_00720 [Oceanobacillus sp.]|nr:hypothetical protein [Oceanobacillus sp.]
MYKNTFYVYYKDSDISHHGIKGQRWGVRRFQNPDGSLTAAGQKRYGKDFDKMYTKAFKNENRVNVKKSK